MRTYRVDLHNHSPHVSGDYRGPADTSPHDLVTAALGAGIDVIAVSDHFSIAYAEHVIEAAKREWLSSGRRLTVLPGAELKVRWRGDEVHLIALFAPDGAEQRFVALQAVLSMPTGDDPTYLHRAVIEHDPVEAARAIVAVGGICTIAHADRRFGEYRLLDGPLLPRLLASAPISAVELIDPASEEDVRRLTQRPVRFISSSDAHSPQEMGRRHSEIELAEPTFSALRAALDGDTAAA